MGQTAERTEESPHAILTTGERIRLLRGRHNWSLRDMARESGVNQGTLSEIERDATNTSAENIRRVAVALGTSTDYLLRLRAMPSKRSGQTRQKPPNTYVQPPLVASVRAANPAAPSSDLARMAS